MLGRTRRANLRAVAFALIAVGLLLAAGSVFVGNRSYTGAVVGAGDSQLQMFLEHIQHVVVVVMENHAFDTMYGTYCQTKGPYCPMTVAGIPRGTCVPYYPKTAFKGCIRPFPFNATQAQLNYPLPHSHNSSLISWDNGAMNGFYSAENSGTIPFGYYDGNTTPLMWEFAEEYGLGDDYFGGTLSYSLPTHWSFVSGGNGPALIENFSLENPPNPNGTSGDRVRSLYLQAAQNVTTVEDLLNNTTTSWDYYESSFQPWVNASNVTEQGGAGVQNAFNYWNPQEAKKESYGPQLRTHFVENQQFFYNAANGTLPALSWVVPYYRFSEHPAANITLGDEWLAMLIDSVEASPDWNTTALFITYDEYGGFYDNVPPPLVDGNRLGFRLPLIVISPYTSPGLVDSSMLDPWSILALFEARGNLGCFSALDCTAPSALGFFNFSAPPRPPMLFPVNDSFTSYPLPVQPADAPWVPVQFQVPYPIEQGEGESSGFVD